ncbi:hypothetical protein Tco_1082202 [Tanacetum coccineum]|uniref:Uncharacterized protein n=1 Tax=Tanacetum coccineum TaxID=301880 RepID=A0ABQ5I1E0_9ASTR
MFESGTYKSLPKHVALFKALEASMERAQRDEFLAEKDKSHKRQRDDQDPPPPPPDSNTSKKRRHTSDASGSSQPPAPHLFAWKTTDAREDPSSSSKQYRENNWANALANSHKDPEENKLLRKTGDMGSFITWFCKIIGKKKLSKSDLEGPTYKDLEYLVSGDKGRRSALSISKMKVAQYLDFGLEELVLSLWIKSEREYDIVLLMVSLIGGSSVKNSTSQDIMAPLIAAQADYKEYKILEADFKILHPNDFKDLYQLHLQGQLNHLSRADKDAFDFLFKEDNTIASKPRPVIYRDRNDQKKMMRETEVHKFNDGTLNRILDKLDHMVKDFKLFKYNKGMETRIWFKDDRRRSKEFMEVIERRLKIRRIFMSLESFVGGRLRDVDYSLIQRIE